MNATNRFKDDAALANRYLADQLSDAERAAFEDELTSDPAVAREVEATARLKVGLQRLQETGELNPLVQSRPFFRRPAFLAMAASIGVLAIGLMIVRSMPTSSEQLLAASVSALVNQSGRDLSVGESHAVFRARDVAYDAVIVLPDTPQAIELRVLPEIVAKAASYSVALLRLGDDGRTEAVAEIRGLQPGADGFLSVFADSSRLRPGRYQLTVVGEGTEAVPLAAGTFLIKVQ